MFVPGNEVDVCPRPSIRPRPRRDITDRVTFFGQTDWVALAIHQVAANELRSHEGTHLTINEGHWREITIIPREKD